jgi:hypothetical protein
MEPSEDRKSLTSQVRLTKAALAAVVAEGAGIPRRAAAEVVELILDCIVRARPRPVGGTCAASGGVPVFADCLCADDWGTITVMTESAITTAEYLKNRLRNAGFMAVTLLSGQHSFARLSLLLVARSTRSLSSP